MGERMRIEHLREFNRLAHTLNYRRTAKELFVTQPALSRHILAIEEELGVELLSRSPSGVKLTEEGTYFLRESEAIVQRFDAALGHLKDMQGSGGLGIGMLYYSKELIVPAIARFQELYPAVRLHFISKTPCEVFEALMARTIDVGNLLHVDFKGSDELELVDIYQEPMVLMTSSSHRLSKEGPVSVSQLEGETFVNVDDVFYQGYFQYVRGLLLSHGVTINPNPHLVPNVEEMMLGVQAGFGVALLSHNLRKQTSPLSTFHDIVEEDVVIRRCLAYLPDNHNPALQDFLDLFDFKTFPD